MSIKNLIIFLFFTLISFQCSNKDVQKIVQEWQGKQIQIPSHIVPVCDTLDLWDNPYKILVYIDSTDCTACQLQLPLWKELIDICHTQKMKVIFLFVIHSNDYTDFKYDLLAYNFDYPIVYDRHNDFDQLNHFPPLPYRTFLLDKDNKVLLVGSPIKNPKMWALYEKIITQ